MMQFEGFPKLSRLLRPCVITEKLDGTNAQIYICPEALHPTGVFAGDLSDGPLATRDGMMLYAGSRTRYLTVAQDNFGFAAWASVHAHELFELGEGRHFGEWWGHKIQRGYGLEGRRFSLFNTHRWGPGRDLETYPGEAPACCSVVPVLYRGLFRTEAVLDELYDLESQGSRAVPGYLEPEGVVIYHEAAGMSFKVTLEHDEAPKGTVQRGER